MEITRTNLREQLPEIIRDIQRSLFVSFDQEFTGLSSEQTWNPYATLEETYSNKLRTGCGFVVIQFGLTCFFGKGNDDDGGGLTYRSYNFYVCPRRRHSVFQCEGQAMSFLSRNNFDFNKLFREGIPYCDILEGEKLKELMRGRQTKRAEVISTGLPDTGNHIKIPEKEEALVERISASVDEFLKDDSGKEELALEGLNSFQRRLVYQTLESKFFQRTSASTVNNVLIVKRTMSLEAEEEERLKKEEADLEDQIGMTNVMMALSESKKLLVGHNIFQDLLYCIRQFFRPLPEAYSEFKSLVHELFPYIIDTKYLCTHDQLRDLLTSTVLIDVLRGVRKDPFALPEIKPDAEEYAYDLDADKQHEAGYDSFICGVSLIGMCTKIGISWTNTGQPLEKSPILKRFLNRIFVMGINDINCFNLGGKDATPQREHVFHLTIPATWKRVDIMNRFKDFGGCQVHRLSDTTAFVGLQQKDFAVTAFKALQSSPEMKLTRYADYAKAAQYDDSSMTVKRKTSDDSPVAEKPGGKKLKEADVDGAKSKGNFPTNEDWTT